MGNGGYLLTVLYFFNKDDKLVPSHTSDNIHGTQSLSETQGDFLEEPVSRFMSQHVVDNFKTIQVNEKNGQFPIMPFCRVDGMA